jgi:hypothetical protein
MTPDEAVAATIVDRIIDDILDRRGLKSEWRAIDAPLQGEIRQAWMRIVRECLDLSLARFAAPTERPSAVAVPMLLWCPGCGERHVDKGPFATNIHHTHACQNCGLVWRPALVATVGVDFLPGFKDPPGEEDAGDREDDALPPEQWGWCMACARLLKRRIGTVCPTHKVVLIEMPRSRSER